MVVVGMVVVGMVIVGMVVVGMVVVGIESYRVDCHHRTHRQPMVGRP